MSVDLAYNPDQWNEAPGNRAAVSTALLGAWFDTTRTYTLQQYLPEQIDPNDAPTGDADTQVSAHKSLDLIWNMIPKFRLWGVDSNLLNQIIAWARPIWTNAPWNEFENATDLPPQVTFLAINGAPVEVTNTVVINSGTPVPSRRSTDQLPSRICS